MIYRYVNASMKTIAQILNEIRPDADFSVSADFVKDSLLDSLDIIELVSALESAYSISIDGSDIIPENFINVESIERLAEKYMQNSRNKV